MENDKNKINKFLIIIFIALSVIYIAYAVLSLRGIWGDGAIYQIFMFQEKDIYYLKLYSRDAVTYLQGIPALYTFLLTKSKILTMMVFSFMQIGFPYILLLYSYYLGVKTATKGIFLLGLTVYILTILPVSILSVYEGTIACILILILYQYLVSEKEYSIFDCIIITLITISTIIGLYEFVIFIGPIFLMDVIINSGKNCSKKQLTIKYIIAFFVCIAALIYTIHLFEPNGVNSELGRVISEFLMSLKRIPSTNLAISFISLIFILFSFKLKRAIPKKIIISVLTCVFILLVINKNITLMPVYEQDARTINALMFPAVIFLFAIFRKKNCLNIKMDEIILIVIICGIFQTLWQMMNTYYWNENIKFLKNEISNSTEQLYENINNPFIISNPVGKTNMRRYISPFIYTITYILVAENKKIDKIPVSYDLKQIDTFEGIEKDKILTQINQDKIKLLYTYEIDKQNEIWDLSDIK